MPTYDQLRGRVAAMLEHYERALVATPGVKVDPSDVVSQLRAVLTPAVPEDPKP